MLYILGINYKSAPVAIREKLAFPEGVRIDGVNELVSLSTCNRTELITTFTNREQVKNWLQTIGSPAVQPYLYEYTEQTAITHLARVACGLDSMVLGEPQILGQMKTAYAQATTQGCVGNYLGHLFPFVFSLAKKIRSQTGISANSLSVAYMAVNLAGRIFADLTTVTVLLIGGGKTIQSVARYLANIPIRKIIIANRTLEKSATIAQKFSAEAIRIAGIPDVLSQADMVISSTASQLPLLGKGLLENVIKQRQHKPIFLIDLAVPRDIEPEVADLADVFLYNIDDLQKIIQENLQHRERAAQQAEGIIQTEIVDFVRWQASLEAVPVIRAYREKMTQLRDDEIVKAKQALIRGTKPEEVVQRLARDLTNKLMHVPTIAMRQASYEEQGKLLTWLKHFFKW